MAFGGSLAKEFSLGKEEPVPHACFEALLSGSVKCELSSPAWDFGGLPQNGPFGDVAPPAQ